MPCRIAINGYGRIGRCILRAFHEAGAWPELRIVAINDLASLDTIAHLTRYDSTHGRFAGAVEVRGGEQLVVNQQPVSVSRHPQVDDLPWAELDVDLVLECSGAFTSRSTAERHLAAGATRVLFSQPARRDVDCTVVYGVNHQSLKAEHRIVSNASCTTNCIVPVLQVLDEELGIVSGTITTIHSAMNDQPVLDSYHHHDLRRSRSAMQSIIPVDTQLAIGIDRILPGLGKRLVARAIRVPTLNVSALDLTVRTGSDTDAAAVNALIRRHCATPRYAQVMGFTDEALASCDFNHDARSAIVDLDQTRVAGSNLVNMLVWFDNEWAYANRMLDVARHMHTVSTGQ